MLPEKIILAPPKNGSNHNNHAAKLKMKIPDLFIYLQDQLISVVRSTLSCCGLINNQVQSNQKIIFITEPLDVLDG